jgi:hypothetical protein
MVLAGIAPPQVLNRRRRIILGRLRPEGDKMDGDHDGLGWGVLGRSTAAKDALALESVLACAPLGRSREEGG